MWDLPRPGIEPVSPALAGGFLATVPLGKPLNMIFKLIFLFRKKAKAETNNKKKNKKFFLLKGAL